MIYSGTKIESFDETLGNYAVIVLLSENYSLLRKEAKKIVTKNNVSATSDYSAAVTFTGFATEIARRDTYERLVDTVAEKMITEILIANQIKYSP